MRQWPLGLPPWRHVLLLLLCICMCLRDVASLRPSELELLVVNQDSNGTGSLDAADARDSRAAAAASSLSALRQQVQARASAKAPNAGDEGGGAEEGGAEEHGTGEHGNEDEEEQEQGEKDDGGENGKAEEGEEEQDKEEEAEEESEPYHMTKWEKLWLGSGWLLEFVAWCIVLAVSVRFLGSSLDEELETEGVRPPVSGRVQKLYDHLYGESPGSVLVDLSVVSVSSLNFITWALSTEARFDAEATLFGSYNTTAAWDVPLVPIIFTSNDIIEKYSMIYFAVLYGLRLAAVKAHPSWYQYGALAPLHYACRDTFMVLDLVGIATTVIDIVLPGRDYLNLMWLALARSIEMMIRHKQMGMGMATLRNSFRRDGKMLGVVGLFGLVCWLVMSGFYHVANHNNENTVWEAVDYKPWGSTESEGWNRFESIPSSMFFVLVNLVREHPLADAFTTPFQQIIIVFMVVLATPFFALPTGALESLLTTCEETEEGEDDTFDEEGYEDFPEGGREVVGRFFGTLVGAYGSVFVYFFWTAGPTTFLWMPVHVDKWFFILVDAAASVVFLGEYGWRSKQRGAGYFTSVFGIMDFLAWLPGLIHVICYALLSDAAMPYWLHAACIFRVFKLERYLKAFTMWDDIIRRHKRVLQATMCLALLTLLIFSTALFVTEQGNPDEEIQENYGSIPRALWAEVVNLHGEFPWCDYTASGKAICTVIALFSIILFTIPISVFANGFMDIMAESEEPPDINSEDMAPWMWRYRPTSSSERLQVWRWLYAHLGPGARYQKYSSMYSLLRAISLSLILASAATTCLETLPRFGKDACEHSFLCELREWDMYRVDVIAMAFFSLELFLRCAALGVYYPLSFIGICDFLSLAGLALTLTSRRREYMHPDYESMDVSGNLVIAMRLLRLACIESWLGALHVLTCVFQVYWKSLVGSGYTLLALTYFFATVLHILERHHHDGDDIEQATRYGDVLTAIQYTLVHLTGDYPVTAYTLPAKFVHCFMIVFGCIAVSTFTGIFSAGYVEILQKQRNRELQHIAASQLQASVNAASKLQRHYRRAKKAIEMRTPEEREALRRRKPENPIRKLALDFTEMRTPQGMGLMIAANLVLGLNLINTMIQSLPEVGKMGDGEWGQSVHGIAQKVEVMCSLFFFFEYCLRLCAGNSALVMLKPGRILDLICLLPFFATVWILTKPDEWLEKHETAVMVQETALILRCARLLDMPYIRREVVMVSRTLKAAGPQLVMPAVLALDIWIICSCLFVLVENMYDGPTREDMSSIPNSMYWSSIFLLGEWANVDFSPGAGSRLCIFYCLFGKATFAIPFGIMIDSAQSTLATVSLENKAVAELQSMASAPISGFEGTWLSHSKSPVTIKGTRLEWSNGSDSAIEVTTELTFTMIVKGRATYATLSSGGKEMTWTEADGRTSVWTRKDSRRPSTLGAVAAAGSAAFAKAGLASRSQDSAKAPGGFTAAEPTTGPPVMRPGLPGGVVSAGPPGPCSAVAASAAPAIPPVSPPVASVAGMPPPGPAAAVPAPVGAAFPALSPPVASVAGMPPPPAARAAQGVVGGPGSPVFSGAVAAPTPAGHSGMIAAPLPVSEDREAAPGDDGGDDMWSRTQPPAPSNNTAAQARMLQEGGDGTW
eukprot:TRINITY_DN17744_c0_g2_i1.p1 TRINITY_DN17744_c0_g2~~TRINITY_DN17744_c0_g2_i1.p1  ORF type:complete len:1635 (+),score=290.89 TRINITY_DN17744_c0_g2_i1:80-4984(+)